MKLVDAYNLLLEDGILDNHRYFSEVYKLFQFRDDQTLKEYLDFIDHEPVAWLEGFPAKLTTKQTFSKPKTALIKLLKKDEVSTALGLSYVNKVYDVVWNTFKKEHQRILDKRQSNQPRSVLDHFDTESHESLPVPIVRQFHPPLNGLRSVSGSITEIGNESLPDLEVGTCRGEYRKEENQKSPEERIRILKDVLFRLCESLPAGTSDAFRLLVETV
jgi:hypothetical protein